jgi:elongin-A
MELLSPQIATEDQEIWLEFIKRDIPQWETYDLPEKSNNWYEVYCDLREIVQRSLDADAEKMKMAIDGIQSERARLTPKIISGTRARRIGGIGPSFRQRVVSSAAAPRKSTIFTPQRRNTSLAMPTKHLNTRATQVRQAPRSLIEEHRRPVEPPKRENDARAPVAPGRVKQGSSQTVDNKGPSLAEREARLRSLTSGKPMPHGAGEIRKVPVKEASSPAKKPIPKRQATSPPPQASPTSSSYYSPQPSATGDAASESTSTTAPRPAVVRKRPDDVFIRPKRKRVF